MFDIAPAELLVLGVVAIAVIPPKDLPRAMRVAGEWIGKVRGIGRQFRSGFDEIIRESEVQEMEKKWRAENERIMREHPPTSLLDPAPPLSLAKESEAPATDAPAVRSEGHADARDEPVPVMTARPVIRDERDHDREVATMVPLGPGDPPPLDRST